MQLQELLFINYYALVYVGQVAEVVRSSSALASPEPYWRGDDPLYGDPGVGKITHKMVREAEAGLPFPPTLLTAEDVQDARRARFMSR